MRAGTRPRPFPPRTPLLPRVRATAMTRKTFVDLRWEGGRPAWCVDRLGASACAFLPPSSVPPSTGVLDPQRNSPGGKDLIKENSRREHATPCVTLSHSINRDKEIADGRCAEG